MNYLIDLTFNGTDERPDKVEHSPAKKTRCINPNQKRKRPEQNKNYMKERNQRIRNNIILINFTFYMVQNLENRSFKWCINKARVDNDDYLYMIIYLE